MSFTPDQEELRRYAREWLDDHASFAQIRPVIESGSGFDPAQWRELADLGWLGMAVSESAGGAGYGFSELAVIGEEMGRSLYPSPFLPTVVMAAALLDDLGDDMSRQILGSVVSGDTTVSVAFSETGRPWATDGFTTSAEEAGGGWALTGTKRFVLSGATADALLVAASTPDGTGLFLVDGDAVGLTRTPVSVMDLTRPQADLALDSTPATLVGDIGPQASRALGRMLELGVAFLAMEQVGGAQACLDMAVEYAKTRHQFGRAIGSFQAVKHMCAEMLIDVEGAKSAAYHLATVVGSDPAEAAVAGPIAKSVCSQAYYRCAADTIQIHGGIGFTWEHNAHLYFKRAKSSALLFGDGREHRQHLAGTLGI